ncbi:hypothetical protein VIBHAR_05252 [Vibrio campbellii ATCC BAA-1116]|uniref:Uncharacterized protein n=1 Tax=Vibrio campbellii (strain ATCC BAA-1116) TaxID=2902295 RepID=A7N641_VIBC1|nr:hypothetical protein VIBHAR_05252 [Vibrio campbellii ATCC BAA-1116]
MEKQGVAHPQLRFKRPFKSIRTPKPKQRSQGYRFKHLFYKHFADKPF